MFAKCLQTNGKASKISKTCDGMGFWAYSSPYDYCSRTDKPASINTRNRSRKMMRKVTFSITECFANLFRYFLKYSEKLVKNL